MKKACKSPSEWLRLLCRDWAVENIEIAEATDLKFLAYKSYLKGKLTSQLLCRISIPELGKDYGEDGSIDFWKTLGIHDEFDIRFIISQVEKFCSMYSIRSIDETPLLDESALEEATKAAAAAAAGLTVSPLHNYLATSLDITRPSPVRRGEPRRLPLSTAREISVLSKESDHGKIAEDQLAKEFTREDKRQLKLLERQKREDFEQQRKDAALQRAADLVRSNRVPIEITRGAKVARAVQRMVNANTTAAKRKVKGSKDSVSEQDPTKDSSAKDDNTKKKRKKKARSDISVSTASDLDQIVTHSKNLFIKYNAIANAHNQRISWAMISKELGMHNKVREKYARMHSRALQSGFDFTTNGHYMIKDHPEIFIGSTTKKRRKVTTAEDSALGKASSDDDYLPTSLINQPMGQEQAESHILHTDHGQEINISDVNQMHEGSSHPTDLDHHNHLPSYSRDMSQHITDDQVAAAVDAAIKTVPVNQTTDYAAAEEAAEVALCAHL
mmetsp:Transcript_1958/g.2976  ORF Transcript_1958/g.2976 Transcript_1958/m.2976 type:complete len:500 (-) Transcript_1958:19-1518(-)